MKAYLANGLFSQADRLYNTFVAGKIRERFYVKYGEEEKLDLYLPQENLSINDKSQYADSKAIMEADREKLMESDVLIAIIDGIEIDSGVACEIGMFATTGKPIFALYTDSRQEGTDNADKITALIEDTTENQFPYRNLFVIGVIKENGQVFKDIHGLTKAINEYEENKNKEA